MPTIKEIIDKFDKRTKEFQKDGYETMTIECVRGILKDSLTSMLDGIEKELPEEVNTDTPYNDEGNLISYGKNLYRQEVINIINSHR